MRRERERERAGIGTEYLGVAVAVVVSLASLKGTCFKARHSHFPCLMLSLEGSGGSSSS